MNYEKLKEIGLTEVQISQVLSEHMRAIGSPLSEDKQLEDQRKRDEILAIKDTSIRQRLIAENADLFR